MNPMDLSPNYVATVVSVNRMIAGCTGFISPIVTGAMTAGEVGTSAFRIVVIAQNKI